MGHQHADAVSCKVLIRNPADRSSVWLVCYTHEDGHYSLPGGRIDQGETPAQAVRRELQEEIGAEITNLQLRDAWFMLDDERRNYTDTLVLFFTADLVQFTRQGASPAGEVAAKWSLADIDTAPGLRSPYKQAIRKLIQQEQ